MLVLGEHVPIKENLKKSFHLYWFLWLLLILTASIDFITTISFMWKYGIHIEGNLVVRWLAHTFGILPGVFIGKSLQIVAAIGFSALSFSLARTTLLLILLLNLVAAIKNILL